MGVIKCIYVRPRCTYYGDLSTDCKDPDSDKLDYNCERFSVNPIVKYQEINPPCMHRLWEPIMFEKTAKTYELDYSGLTIGRLYIPRDYINYLCIDGKEIITQEENK